MQILPLKAAYRKTLNKYGLADKFEKQKKLFELDPHHPSLHTEKLLPKHLNIYSFRIDRKWRAIFIVTRDNKAEIIDINLHYR